MSESFVAVRRDVRSDRERTLAVLLFDDEASAEHSHRAGEGEFAWFLGKKFDWHGLSGRQIGALLKVGEDHLVRARRRLFAAEIQPDRPAATHDDGVGRI